MNATVHAQVRTSTRLLRSVAAVFFIQHSLTLKTLQSSSKVHFMMINNIRTLMSVHFHFYTRLSLSRRKQQKLPENMQITSTTRLNLTDCSTILVQLKNQCTAGRKKKRKIQTRLISRRNLNAVEYGNNTSRGTDCEKFGKMNYQIRPAVAELQKYTSLQNMLIFFVK